MVSYPWAAEFKEDLKNSKIVRLAQETKERLARDARYVHLDEASAFVKLRGECENDSFFQNNTW